MRRPTPVADLFAHHTASLRGEEAHVFADEPECGWWKMRMIKAGPWVPVRIWCIQSLDEHGALAAPEEMRAVRGTDDVPVLWVWPRCAGKPTTEEAYHDLLGRKDDDEMVATHAVVDLSERPMRP